MSMPPDKDGPRTALTTIGVVLLPVLCCGLPVLIAAGALGATGSVLGSPWLIGGAVAVLLGVVMWRVRRASGSGDDACCPPDPPGYDTTGRSFEAEDQQR